MRNTALSSQSCWRWRLQWRVCWTPVPAKDKPKAEELVTKHLDALGDRRGAGRPSSHSMWKGIF